MDFQPLKYIYQPATGSGVYTLLLLHGTGGDENDLLPIAKEFGNNINVLSLRGNVQEGGMPRFFKRLGMGVFDEQYLRFRTAEMIAFLKELAIEKDFDIDKIIALGYSNGANIIGSTLMLEPDFFAGAIMYRPMQPFKQPEPFESLQHRPVFMSNGNQDPTIDPQATIHYVAALKAAGFIVIDHQLATGHNLTQNDLNLSVDWYHKNFGDAGL